MLRQRHHLSTKAVHMQTRPRIPSDEIVRWEAGKSGSVSDKFRRVMYDALRTAIIESALKAIRLLKEHQEAEATAVAKARPEPPRLSGFIMGEG